MRRVAQSKEEEPKHIKNKWRGAHWNELHCECGTFVGNEKMRFEHRHTYSSYEPNEKNVAIDIFFSFSVACKIIVLFIVHVGKKKQSKIFLMHNYEPERILAVYLYLVVTADFEMINDDYSKIIHRLYSTNNWNETFTITKE